MLHVSLPLKARLCDMTGAMEQEDVTDKGNFPRRWKRSNNWDRETWGKKLDQ